MILDFRVQIVDFRLMNNDFRLFEFGILFKDLALRTLAFVNTNNIKKPCALCG